MNRREFIHTLAGVGVAGLMPTTATASEDAYFSGHRAALGTDPWLGAFTGVSGQLDSGPIKFEGSLPRALRGVLYRNGPAMIERAGQRYQHLFDGDGMIQAYTFSDRGVSHRGRFVRTQKFIREQEAGKFLVSGFGTKINGSFPVSGPDAVNVANTNVVVHGNRLMALWEAGSAHELDPATLETKGTVTWARELKGVPFSAHPKVEADGTLWNFGAFAGVLVLYQIEANGKLVKTAAIKVPGLPMIHDFVVTARHLVFVLPAMNLSLEKMRGGASLLDSIDFPADQAMRVLTIEKGDFSKQRFYELPPGFMFHHGNGWEDRDGVIHFDFVSHTAGASFMTQSMRAMMRGDVAAMTPAESRSTRVVIDPARNTIRHETRGGVVEFPQIDPRFAAQQNRQLYHVGVSTAAGVAGNTFAMNTVLREDLDSGKTDSYRFGDGYCLEEHIVVPRPGSRIEGDGWLVGAAFNAKTVRSELFVFDAQHLADGPIVTAKLPYAVPLGFHGNFWAA